MTGPNVRRYRDDTPPRAAVPTSTIRPMPAAPESPSLLLHVLQRFALLVAFAVGGRPTNSLAALARRRRAEARRRASGDAASHDHRRAA